MNIVVCVKQVPDPETPPAGFKVDAAAKRVIPPLGAALVINPFDENAVEAALRIKDACGARVTALTMGSPSAEDVLRQAMAMGVDEGVLLESTDFEDSDSFATAYLLAMAIKKTGAVDLVLCGREAADWNSGQVGLGIAEVLRLPGVTLVRKIEVEDGQLRIERVIPNGFEVVEVSLPAVLTVTNELGNPRYPNIKGVMAAKKKEITVLRAQDIEPDSSRLDSRLELTDLFLPVMERKCHIFPSDNLEEGVSALTEKIMELNPNHFRR